MPPSVCRGAAATAGGDVVRSAAWAIAGIMMAELAAANPTPSLQILKLMAERPPMQVIRDVCPRLASQDVVDLSR